MSSLSEISNDESVACNYKYSASAASGRTSKTKRRRLEDFPTDFLENVTLDSDEENFSSDGEYQQNTSATSVSLT